MGLRINQNIAAQNAYRNLSVTDNQMSKSLEKLSSGFRINRAADDAAGLSISEGLRAQTGGLKVAVRNAQDAISVVQTSEGALNEVTSMLQRMRDLAVQSNNASLDESAKKAANAEFSQLASEIDRVSETTSFGKSKLLDGSFGMVAEKSGTLAGTAATTGTPPTPAVSGVGGLTTPLTGMTLAVTGKDGSTTTLTLADVSTVDANNKALSPQALASQVNSAISTAIKNEGLDLTVELTAEFNASTGETTFTASGTADFELTASDLGISGPSDPKGNATPGAFQIGANSGETLNVGLGKIDSKTLGLSNLDLTKTAANNGGKTGAAEAMEALDVAIQSVSDTRAKLGAHQNRFEHTINNLNVAVENLSASESRIRDTDMAQEMVGFTRNQILTQAGTSMLSQANQASQNVLSLLR
ncbi:flagellin [Actinoplanes italicus]|uniref:Flagellin n=1 Tax=Actinoplanes italicus TaxID=113567 RepID=A0A2T0KL34_9ACTN|nr:flagellin [Actinoplanes italicus]PRX24345.1 flagellin [Actinoplanes italicus]GIE27929.1 flagellin [Actinoplanes italicus]